MNRGWKNLHDHTDVTATLLIPERDPSLRWGDGLESTVLKDQDERSVD
jgi:hypothetical protein